MKPMRRSEPAMTAINELVWIVCGPDAKGANGLEPGLAEAREALSSLYASVYEILEAFLSLELLRVEFRMPAAPPSQEPAIEEKSPAPVPNEAREVTVGPINVYAITREIREALDRLSLETLDVTAAYTNYIPQERLPVITPAARAAEAREPAPQAERPQQEKRPVESKNVEIPPLKADHVTIREAPRIEKASRSPPVRPEWAEALKETPSRYKEPAKKISADKPMHEEAVEREVRRSVTVINELRKVYDVLLTDVPIITGLEKESGGFSLPEMAFSSALRLPSHAEEIPAPSTIAENAPSVQAPSSTVASPQPSISIPVPMARPITPRVTPAAPTPGEAPVKGRLASPEALPKMDKGKDEVEPIKLRIVHKSIEVPLIKPVLKAPPTAEDSAANARMISEAIARSTAPIAPPESLATPAPVKNPAMGHHVPPTTAVTPPNTAATSVVSPVQAARALSTVYSTVHHTVNVMEGYAKMAASVSRAAGEAAEIGRGAYAEAPITRLLYASSSPIASTTLPINPPLTTGQMQALYPASEGRIEASAPAMNLAMGIAASRAMQSAGGSAINNFISVVPTLGGGLQGVIPVERIGGGQINIQVPPISVERGQEAGAVSKVSNFHNTFNITVSVKGGGDDGDLRELGKKIGRILSDEVKRYGGI
jgi:hypothetical protein